MIQNYEIKKQLIQNGCYKTHKKCSYVLWRNEQIKTLNLKTLKHAMRFEGEMVRDIIEPYKIGYIDEKFANAWYDMFDSTELKCLNQMSNAEYHRNKRLYNKIESMFLKFEDLIFITLTFRDDILESTSYETRRRYVARYLKERCENYVANVDYGKKNGREHYHGIITKRIDPTFWINNYGACKFKVVHVYNFAAISKYITKFTNHALKETTKFTRCIYSRNN